MKEFTIRCPVCDRHDLSVIVGADFSGLGMKVHVLNRRNNLHAEMTVESWHFHVTSISEETAFYSFGDTIKDLARTVCERAVSKNVMGACPGCGSGLFSVVDHGDNKAFVSGMMQRRNPPSVSVMESSFRDHHFVLTCEQCGWSSHPLVSMDKDVDVQISNRLRRPEETKVKR